LTIFYTLIKSELFLINYHSWKISLKIVIINLYYNFLINLVKLNLEMEVVYSYTYFFSSLYEIVSYHLSFIWKLFALFWIIFLIYFYIFVVCMIIQILAKLLVKSLHEQIRVQTLICIVHALVFLFKYTMISRKNLMILVEN
jgi:hypothetical protein